jgi:hypothetical protein
MRFPKHQDKHNYLSISIYFRITYISILIYLVLILKLINQTHTYIHTQKYIYYTNKYIFNEAELLLLLLFNL